MYRFNSAQEDEVYDLFVAKVQGVVMREYKHVFFFIVLILFMPFHSEGMNTIERATNDLVTFLSRHSDILLVTTLVGVQLLDFGEESDSEEESYSWLLYKQEKNTEKPVARVVKISEVEPEGELIEETDLLEGGLGAVVPFLLWDFVYGK